MSGGGGKTAETTNKPWGALQQPIKDILPGFSEAAQNIPQYYPDQTYANFDPLQQQAMQQQLGYAGSDQLNSSIGNQFGALNYGLNSAYDPQSNPVINDYVASATRPLTEAYQNAVGNTIAGGASGVGGLGGSRQGVAEGQATKAYLNALGDTSTGIYNNAYNQGLDQQARMLALAPQTMQAGLYPSQLTGQVGAQQQGMAQQGINESMNRYDYNQNAEYKRLQDYFNTLSGTPFMTTQAPNPNQQNNLASMIGTGTAGLGLLSAIPEAWGSLALLGGI